MFDLCCDISFVISSLSDLICVSSGFCALMWSLVLILCLIDLLILEVFGVFVVF